MTTPKLFGFSQIPDIAICWCSLVYFLCDCSPFISNNERKRVKMCSKNIPKFCHRLVSVCELNTIKYKYYEVLYTTPMNNTTWFKPLLIEHTESCNNIWHVKSHFLLKRDEIPLSPLLSHSLLRFKSSCFSWSLRTLLSNLFEAVLGNSGTTLT